MAIRSISSSIQVFRRTNLSMRAFKNTPVVIQGEQLGNLFHELRLKLKSNEPETICLGEMIQGDSNLGEHPVNAVAGSDDSLQEAMENLDAQLASVLSYVDSVVEGKTKADPEIGRIIAEALSTVPRVHPDIFDKIFHESLKDLLMVTFLSNITRTQLTISEKLNESLGKV